jgi:hypothetical protein
MVNDGKIPRGLLIEGRPAIRNCLKEFMLAKKLDEDNERHPTMSISRNQDEY